MTARHILRQCLLMLLFVACGVSAYAQEADSTTTAATAIAPEPASYDRHTILVISAYHEDEPWAIKMMMQLNNHFMLVDSVDVVSAYMSNFLINNRETYDRMVDNLFSTYRRPDCVILLGNFAFTLRDRIKSEWGEQLPFLVITRAEGISPLEDYFTDNLQRGNVDSRKPLSSFRQDYNFTAILSPDYPKATVDLMMSLIPDIDELVFMSDPSYVNRVASNNIYNYLLEEYPSVNYKWLVASKENSYEFRQNLVKRNGRKGLLISSWAYDTKSLLGENLVTTRDLNFIMMSSNPVFTLRKAYLNLGCVGGVFADNDSVSNIILQRTEQMLRGENMRDIPFYYPHDNNPVIEYPILTKYGLNESKCPEDTVFRNRPQSFFERYWLVALLTILVVLAIIILLVVRNRLQRRQIGLLTRHIDFVDNMPLPYCAVEVILNAHDRLVDIVFIRKNKAYSSLIEDNTNPDDPIHLLPSKFVAQKARELLDGKKYLTFAYHLECTDTYYDFMYYLTGVTQKEDGSKVVQIDVFARNVTDQHNLQANLVKASEHLEMAVEVANVIPWHLNLNTKLITREKDIQAIKSETRTIVETTYPLADYLERVAPEDRHILLDMLSRFEKGELTDGNASYRVRSDDEPKYDWVQNRMKVVDHNDNGTASKIIGTLRIVTAEKEAEERLRIALERAQQSDKMKSIFLANMSHEIRTPLNAIVGFSNLLANLEDGDTEDKQEIIDVITNNNELLLTLINDIIDLAKIESDNIDLAETNCDVESLLESIAKTITVRLPQGVKLNIAHYSDRLEAVLDPSRVSQILINFLVNACKFTTQGSITLGVELRDHGSMLYFFVKDTGMGIAVEDQPKVFERFLKLDQFSQGTGLGLAISKTLVEKMGGEIGVKSDGLGYGSTFWFTVPYRPADPFTPPY